MQRHTMTIPEFCKKVGISRNAGYQAARRGDLPVPVIRIGKRLVLSVAAVEKLLSAENAPGTPK